MKDLENVLNCLQREDPSLKVRIDPDSGQVMHRISRDFLCPVLEWVTETTFALRSQTILCGMGELHIEIIHDRIRREHGIETHLGPLQVAYRETILHEASASGTNTFHLLHLEEQFSSASRSSRQILFMNLVQTRWTGQ